MDSRPTGENPGVDVAEIHRVRQVSRGRQLLARQARMAPVQPWDRTLADDEHGIGSSVVGAEGPVLRQTAAELAEDHDEDMLFPTSTGQVVQEGSDRGGKR